MNAFLRSTARAPKRVRLGRAFVQALSALVAFALAKVDAATLSRDAAGNPIVIGWDDFWHRPGAFLSDIDGPGARFTFTNDPELGLGTFTLTNGGTLVPTLTSGNVAGLFGQFGNRLLPNTPRVLIIGTGGGTIEIQASSAGGTGYAAVGTNALTGSGALTKTGLGELLLLSASDFAGALTISGDRVELRAAGSLLNVASIAVGQSALFVVDNQNGLGTRQNPLVANTNRVSDTAPISLAGGQLLYRVQNAAGTGETFGTTTLGAGQNTIRIETNGETGGVTLSNLARTSSGGTVNFTNTGGAFGAATTGSARALLGQLNGVASSALDLLGGWATVNGTNFASYSVANGVFISAFGTGNFLTQGASIFTPVAGKIYNLNEVGVATLSAGDQELEALRFGNDTSQILAFTSATDRLNVASGSILTDGSVQTRTIGIGLLTAGTTTAIAPQQLTLHNSAGTLTINAAIVDNSSNAAATITVIKDLDGTVQLGAASTYSGGTRVYRGTLTGSVSGSLGSGAVVVKGGASVLQLAASGTSTGTGVAANAPVYLAQDNAEISLTADVPYNAPSDRYSLRGGATLTAYADSDTAGLASLTRVAVFTGGGQVVFDTDAIVRSANLTSTAALGSRLVHNLGTAADLYFSPSGTMTDTATLTLGTGTPWRGLSSSRAGAQWSAGTLIANGDITLQGLVRDGDVATLTLGAASTAGFYSIVNNAGRAITATVTGSVVLDEDSGVSMPSDLTFLVANGATLQPARSLSFGDPTTRPGSGIAKVTVQAGGTLDPGNYRAVGLAAGIGLGTLASPAYPAPVPSPINGITSIQAGARLLLNDASGLGLAPAGTLTLRQNAVLELAHASAFLGNAGGYLNAGQLVWEPDVVVRYGVNSVLGFGSQVVAPGVAAGGVVIELFGANRTWTNQVNPTLIAATGTPLLALENITLGAGVTLTNDSNDRQLLLGRGKLTFAHGLVIAPTALTLLTMQQPLDVAEGATITLGSASKWADANPKTGGALQLTAPNSNRIPTSSTISFLPGSEILFGAQNTWPDTKGIHLPYALTSVPGTNSVLVGDGSSIGLNTANFNEVIGPLTGIGAVLASQDAASLGVGWDATTDFAFDGVFLRTTSAIGVQKNPGLFKIGPTRMTLTNAASDSQGELRVDQGELALTDAARFAFATIRLSKSGTLTWDDTAAATPDRFNSAALATQPVLGFGGTLQIIGSPTSATAPLLRVLDTAVAATTGGSKSYLNIVPGLDTRLSITDIRRFDTATTARSTTWVFRAASLGNAPGSYDSASNYAPNPLNTNNGLISAINPSLVFNATFNTAANTIPGAIGTPLMPSRGDLLGDASLTGGGIGFITQEDFTHGFRLLAASEYAPYFFRDNGTTGAGLNVKLPAGSYDASGDTRFQTLTFSPGTTTLRIAGTPAYNPTPSRVFLYGGGVLVPAGATATVDGRYLQTQSGVGLWLHTFGELTLNATPASDVGVIKTGPGTLNFGPGALNQMRVSFTLDDGIVNLAAGNSFDVVRAQNNYLGVALIVNGGTLNLGGNSQMVSVLNSANALPYGDAAGGTITSAAPASLSVQGSGVFSGHIGGALSFERTGINTLLLTNSNSYTGTTAVRGGVLELRDEGRLANTTALAISHGTLLLQDGGLAHYNQRVPAGIPITFKSGTLDLRGQSAGVTQQTLGTVSLAEGASTITVNSGGSGSYDLALGNLTRTLASGAQIHFASGFGFLGTAGADTTAIHITTSQINGAALALTNQMLGAWAVVNGDAFASYGANGVGALGNTLDGYADYDSTNVTTATAAQNVNDGTSRTLVASRTVNSLRFGASTSATLGLNAGATLTLASGGLLSNFAAANTIGTADSQGAITSGSGELVAWVNQNTLTLRPVLSGAMNLVKGGAGTLILQGNNSYSGTTFVNGGTLALATPSANGTSIVAIPGNVEIRNATLTNSVAQTVKSTASVSLADNATWNLRDAASTTETVAALTLLNQGFGSGNVPLITRASAQATSALNLTASVAITAFTESLGATPTISANVGVLNFTSASPQSIQVSAPNPNLPLGLILAAGIGTVPAGGLQKTGVGLLALGSGVASTFGNPAVPTEVFNIAQGGVRVDAANKLGSNNAITNVQNGTALIGRSATGITGSVQLKGGTLGVTEGAASFGVATAVPASATVIDVQSDSTISLRDFLLPENLAFDLTHHGRLRGSGNLNLVGMDFTNVAGTGSAFTLGNPISTGAGASDYSGTITVNANTILQALHTKVGGEGFSSGNTFGLASIALNGGRLRIRDDGSTSFSISNSAFSYGNNVTLRADSFLDANRATSGPTANTIVLGTLTVPAGSPQLFVDSGNSYRVRFTALDGAGVLMKGGASALDIDGYAAGFTGGIALSGPRGMSVAAASNLNIGAASNVLSTFFTESGFTMAVGKSYTISGALEVGANAGQVANGMSGVTTGSVVGALAIGDSVPVSTGVLRNNGIVGPTGGAASLSATSIRGRGIYQTLGSSTLALSGALADDGATPTVLRVAGESTITLTSTSGTNTGGAEILSGTLKLAPTAAAVNPLGSGPILVRGVAADAAQFIAANRGTLEFSGASIVNTTPISNSGTVRVTSGTTTLGSVSGTTPGYVPGLLEGRSTDQNYGVSRPANLGNFGIKLEPRMAQTNLKTSDAITGWEDGVAWIYSGEFYDADGVFTFAENLDDSTLLVLDGTPRILNTANNVLTTTASTTGALLTATVAVANSATPANSFGMGASGDGWHTFELRIANLSSTAGPKATNGFSLNYGFGLNPNGTTALDGSAFQRPIDPGDGSLFRTRVGGKGDLRVDAGATLNIASFTQIETVSLAGGAQNALLNVTGAGTHDATSLRLLTGPLGEVSIATAATVSAVNLDIAAGTLTKTGPGTLAISAAQTLTGDLAIAAGTVALGGIGSGFGSVIVSGGTLRLTGSISGAVEVNSGTFSGTGRVAGHTTVSGGTISPGDTAPGVLMLAGGVQFQGGTFSTRLSGAASYDQLAVEGAVDFTTATPLLITLGYNPTDGADTFTIVLNDAADAITGRFTYGGTLLTEGKEFNVVSGPFTQPFTITYLGGDGNDATLTAIPEPTAALLLLAGCALTLRRRRQ